MTAKRFMIMDNLPKGTHSSIWDKQKQHNQGIGDELWLGEVVAMLNEGIILAEENEQLRKDSTVLILANQDYRKENEQLKSRCTDYDKALKTLQGLTDRKLKENEKLKERNKKRLQRLKNQRKELKKQQEAIWGYKGDIKQLKKENNELKKQVSRVEALQILRKLEEENEQLKAQLKDCEKRVSDKEVEWLRNNTVWEQMPSNKRTFIKTTKGDDVE